MTEGLLAFDRMAPASVAGLGAIALGLANGGFFARTWGPSIIAFAAAVELALLVSARIELSRLELAVLSLLGTFVCWSALSALWSADSTASLREAERALLYLVALLTMLLVTGRGFSGALLYGVLVATTVVSTYGLVEYLVARPPLDPAEGSLLFEPLGYANAAGIVAVIGAVISCGLALYAPSLIRAVARAWPLVILVPTLVLTRTCVLGARLCLVARTPPETLTTSTSSRLLRSVRSVSRCSSPRLAYRCSPSAAIGRQQWPRQRTSPSLSTLASTGIGRCPR